MLRTVRSIAAIILVTLAAALSDISTRAYAQKSQSVEWCENVSQAFSIELQINGCTAAIQSGTYSGRNLAWAFVNRGHAYHRKGDNDRSIADYDQAIRLNPDNPNNANVFSNRGLAYSNKGDHDRAIADYDQAIRLNPNYAIAFFNRGNQFYIKKDYARAIADYDQAIRLNPNYAQAIGNRSNAYELKKNQVAVGRPTRKCSASQGNYIVVNVLWNDEAGGLVIRSNPNNQSAITALIPMNGIGIGVDECQSGWCRVKHGCDSGWSSARYLAPRETQLHKVTGVSPSDPEGLNVRKAPNSTSAIESTIPYNATDIVVHVCQSSPVEQTKWCLVTYRDSSGWVSARFLTR